jgi:hypothetical protein
MVARAVVVVKTSTSNKSRRKPAFFRPTIFTQPIAPAHGLDASPCFSCPADKGLDPSSCDLRRFQRLGALDPLCLKDLRMVMR